MSRLRILLLCAFAIAAGCDSATLEGAAGNLIVTPVEGGFLLETEETYSCSNYPLVVDVETDGQSVSVEVEGVGSVETCLTAIGPATVVVRYPALDTQPAFELVLEKDGDTDRYEYTCGVAGCFFGASGEPAFSRAGPR